MRGRDAVRDVGEEGLNLGRDAGCGIGGRDLIGILGAGLVADLQTGAQVRRQGGDGRWHDLRQDARPLAAADDEQVQRPLARRDIGAGGPVQDRAADRVADVLARNALRQDRGPGAAGHAVHARREHPVHPTHDAVLFVDHPRQAHQMRCRQRRNGRIAAEPDHDRRAVAQEGPAGGQHPGGDLERCRQLARQPAARGGRGFHDLALDRLGEAAGIARTAVIGGQLDAPALCQQQLGQGLGRKHVAAGASGGDQGKGGGHQRDRRRISANSPCGRVRVSASSMPSAMPDAIMDEPP